MKILVINGPNLNMLGIREPHIYGNVTYAQLEDYIRDEARKRGIEVELFQSNHEGSIIDTIQAAYQKKDGIIINPGGYTFTSIAILDALKSVSIPAVEVHITDNMKREPFRHHSITEMACIAAIAGKGIPGYSQAMDILLEHLAKATI